jgi:Na+/melibiose symporter-like transporter
LLDPALFSAKPFRLGVSQQLLQQVALGGTMIVIPLYLQMVLEYSAFLAGLTLTPLSLTMFAVAAIMGKRVGKRRPAAVIRLGFLLLLLGLIILLPIVPRADTGWWLVVPLLIAGAGLGLLVSQLNNYTLSPISDERVSEAASVNSAAGSFGLSFGLAFGGAILLASLSLVFTGLSNSSSVLAVDQKEQVAQVLEEDAQILSNTQLDALLDEQPQEIQDEIIRINTEARPIALQLALLVPIIAALLGLINSFRMMRLPDPKPSSAAEGMLLG